MNDQTVSDMDDNHTLFQMLRDAGLNPDRLAVASSTYLLKAPNDYKRPNWCLQIRLSDKVKAARGKSTNLTRSLRTPNLQKALRLRVGKLEEVLDELREQSLKAKVKPRERRPGPSQGKPDFDEIAEKIGNPPAELLALRESVRESGSFRRR
jgi:hypothetical protein